MKLNSMLLRQLEDPALEKNERLRQRLEISKRFEEAGDFEAARGALGEIWQGVGVRPQLDGLVDESLIPQVLLRVGALTGWLGSSQQIEGAQEKAKDLLSESVSLFQQLGEPQQAAEGQIELAYCYWREGAFDEARVILGEALRRLGDHESEVRAVGLLRKAIVEASAQRYHDALEILTKSAPIFEAHATDAIKGKFHNELANVLNYLSVAERRTDYTDRALVEYAAAAFHFERAGHVRNHAAVENNLGYLFASLGKFPEAHTHLNLARRLFVRLRDRVHTAQVDETRARAFIAARRYVEGEKLARLAANSLSKGGELALLAEASVTHGVALARLERSGPARAAFLRAQEVCERAGDLEGAGLASLSLIDELGDELTSSELLTAYRRADDYLSNTQERDVLVRLRRAASNALASCERQNYSDKPLSPDIHTTLAGKQSEAEAETNEWDNFVLKEEVRRLEEKYIRLALKDSGGRVSHAARLLGFEDHGSLNSLLKNKYPHLLTSRLPAAPRKRSIINR